MVAPGGGVSVTPRPRFNPRERTPQYPLDRRISGLRAGLDTEGRGKVLYCTGVARSNSGVKISNLVYGVEVCERSSPPVTTQFYKWEVVPC
jgi:hypothetical protein